MPMFKGRRNFAERTLPQCCSSCMAYVTALRDKSPVESFYRDEQDVPIGESKAVTYRNDIYMVLNQRRLSAMTLSQFQDHLNLNKSDTVLQQLRSKMSDEQLLQFTKSRYIQSIGELRAWSDYLEAEYGAQLDSIKSQLDTDTDKHDTTVDDPTPPANPQPTE